MLTPAQIQKQTTHTFKRYGVLWDTYMEAGKLGLLPNPFKINLESLVPPSLDTTYTKSRYLGRFYVQGYKIEINLAYYVVLQSEAQLDDTIAHELAHALQWKLTPHFKNWHGPEFRAIMRAVGFDGRATVSTPYRTKDKVSKVVRSVKDVHLLSLL